MMLLLDRSCQRLDFCVIDILLEYVPTSVAIRLEENRTAVSRPTPGCVIVLIDRQTPGLLHGFAAWLEVCYIHIPLSVAFAHDQGLTVGGDVHIIELPAGEGGPLRDTPSLTQRSAGCRIHLDLPNIGGK